MALLKRQSDKIDVLASVPLLSGLSKKELGLVARNVTEVTIADGTRIVEQGERGREAMIILNGTAVVRRNKRKVKDLGPGDVVGEISLITEAPRTADVFATSEMRVLLADPREFSSIIYEHPRVAVKVLKTVADRLVELQSTFY